VRGWRLRSWKHLVGGREGHRDVEASHLAVSLQDGPAVSTGLVGEPKLWPLQL